MAITFLIFPQLKSTIMATSELCALCSDSMPNDGRYLKCDECAKVYHLGKKCSGISESTFKGMSASKVDKWRCPACRGRQSKANLESLDIPSTPTNTSAVSAQLTEVNEKLDLLLSWKDSVGALHELLPKVDTLLLLTQTVDTLRVSLSEMHKSLNFFSSEYDSLVESSKSHDNVIKELQTEMSTLRSVLAEQAKEIQQLKSNQNDTDQTNRLPNLEIHGIPFKSNEKVADIMTDLAGKLKIDFQPAHMMSAQRLPAKTGSIPPILIRFSSVPLKETWMSTRGSLRSIPLEDSHPRIYFNDNLTDANRKLFWMARTRGKEKGFKYIWTRHGKIYAKQNQSSTVLRIADSDALDLIN